jgi:hypothetical protein
MGALNATYRFLLARGCFYLAWDHVLWLATVSQLIYESGRAVDTEISFSGFLNLRVIRATHASECTIELRIRIPGLGYISLYRKTLQLSGDRAGKITPKLIIMGFYVASSLIQSTGVFLSQVWIVLSRALLTGLVRVLRSALRAVPPVLVAVVVVFVSADAWHMFASPFDDRFWALFGFFLLGSSLLAFLAIRNAAPLELLDQLRNSTRLGRFNPASRLLKHGCTLVGHSAHIVLRLPGHLIITRELLSISTSLGAFSALYFAAVGLQDDDGREVFLSASARSIRRTSDTVLLYRSGRQQVERLLRAVPPTDDLVVTEASVST